MSGGAFVAQRGDVDHRAQLERAEMPTRLLAAYLPEVADGASAVNRPDDASATYTGVQLV
jgi:hypothetical protein